MATARSRWSVALVLLGLAACHRGPAPAGAPEAPVPEAEYCRQRMSVVDVGDRLR